MSSGPRDWLSMQIWLCTVYVSFFLQPSQNCYSSEWYAALPYSIASLIIWGIGIPIACAVVLHRRYQSVHKMVGCMFCDQFNLCIWCGIMDLWSSVNDYACKWCSSSECCWKLTINWICRRFSPDFKERFSLLVGGYRPEWMLWEPFSMFKKVMILSLWSRVGAMGALTSVYNLHFKVS